MPKNTLLIEQCARVLEKIHKEKIATEHPLLYKIRQTSSLIISQKNLPERLVHLLCNLTITYVGMGKCGELSSRFQIELLLDMGLKSKVLCLKGPYKEFNHGLVIIGETIFNGNLAEFIKLNPNLIYVDPLLNFCGTSESLEPLIEYCRIHSIDTVDCVLDQDYTDEEAKKINQNALDTAKSLKPQLPYITKTLLNNKSIFYRPNHQDSLNHFLLQYIELEKTPCTLTTQLNKLNALYSIGKAYLNFVSEESPIDAKFYLEKAHALAQELPLLANNIVFTPSINALLDICDQKINSSPERKPALQLV